MNGYQPFLLLWLLIAAGILGSVLLALAWWLWPRAGVDIRGGEADFV